MIHVDDQLIASNNRLDAFKRLLNKEFECKDNGPISNFLGMEITRDRRDKRIYISQERYLEEILDRFDLSLCSPVKSPSPGDFKPNICSDTLLQGYANADWGGDLDTRRSTTAIQLRVGNLDSNKRSYKPLNGAIALTHNPVNFDKEFGRILCVKRSKIKLFH
jgi:hypothetical protein